MKESFSDKVKWKRLTFKSSIYPTCVVFSAVSLIAIIIICCNFKPDSLVYSLGNSIFTGIIASIIVSVVIQKKQDKEQLERKRAVLFDAGFDVLDVVDISILRSINSEYRFIMALSREISLHTNDKKFLKDSIEIIKVWNEYDKAIRELKRNLFCLLIKWEKDLIIDSD